MTVTDAEHTDDIRTVKKTVLQKVSFMNVAESGEIGS